LQRFLLPVAQHKRVRYRSLCFCDDEGSVQFYAERYGDWPSRCHVTKVGDRYHESLSPTQKMAEWTPWKREPPDSARSASIRSTFTPKLPRNLRENTMRIFSSTSMTARRRRWCISYGRRCFSFLALDYRLMNYFGKVRIGKPGTRAVPSCQHVESAAPAHALAKCPHRHQCDSGMRPLWSIAIARLEFSYLQSDRDWTGTSFLSGQRYLFFRPVAAIPWC